MSIEKLCTEVPQQMIETGDPTTLTEDLKKAVTLAGFFQESTTVLPLASGVTAILQIPEFSGKVRSGWIVFMSTYAKWCKATSVAYDAKVCGALWKALPDEVNARWNRAGGKEPKGQGKGKGKGKTSSPATPEGDSDRLNCSSFFRKLVAFWSNPEKQKGQTYSMKAQAALWNVEKEDHVAKTYWDQVLSVWRDEGRPEMSDFLEKHKEYTTKIQELDTLVQSTAEETEEASMKTDEAVEAK
jgi:hypothetical protein